MQSNCNQAKRWPRRSRAVMLALTVLSAALGGCSTAPANDPRDPFESVNRSMWDVNTKLDKYVLKPTAEVYRDYVPTPVRRSAFSFVSNLDEPVSTVNNGLQGKLKKAGVSFARFLVNSTVGVFGLFDVATEIGLVTDKEDMNQTLGVAGVENGPYLMLPGRGPMTVRDVGGTVADGMVYPATIMSFPQSLLKFGIAALETRIQLFDQDALLDSSLDPYSLVKDAYFQRSEYKVNDGKVTITPEQTEEDENIDAFLEEIQ